MSDMPVCQYARHRPFDWVSEYGVVTCGLCHPPATPELVARWVGDGVALSEIACLAADDLLTSKLSFAREADLKRFRETCHMLCNARWACDLQGVPLDTLKMEAVKIMGAVIATRMKARAS